MTNWSEDPFDFGAEMFDSRDVIERLDYLTDKADDVGLDEDEKDELHILQELENESGTSWDYGMTFINEDYFVQYAKQYAEEIGAASDTNRWPFTCIDWEQAADELKEDYTYYNLNGNTFLSRD